MRVQEHRKKSDFTFHPKDNKKTDEIKKEKSKWRGRERPRRKSVFFIVVSFEVKRSGAPGFFRIRLRSPRLLLNSHRSFFTD